MENNASGKIVHIDILIYLFSFAAIIFLTSRKLDIYLYLFYILVIAYLIYKFVKKDAKPYLLLFAIQGGYILWYVSITVYYTIKYGVGLSPSFSIWGSIWLLLQIILIIWLFLKPEKLQPVVILSCIYLLNIIISLIGIYLFIIKNIQFHDFHFYDFYFLPICVWMISAFCLLKGFIETKRRLTLNVITFFLLN